MRVRQATVSQISNYIKRTMDDDEVLQNIWIKGEISNFKLHYSGHMYITLKDENSILKSVMFRTACSTLNFEPKDGMTVLARGRISVYEPTGAYQLYIEEMKQDGLGDLFVQFEKMKKRLAEIGLFDDENKKPIPKYPKTVGVCTATTGAAVRDIINVITRRYPLAEIIVYPTIVQGEKAPQSIIEAIEYLDDNNLADVLIIGRGGGSIEDLWAFNDEEVAFTIFNCNTPIISAVGHETDFTIADFVADLRAPTPSAAAELAVPSNTELTRKMNDLNVRLKTRVNNICDRYKLLLNTLKLKTPENIISENRLKIDYLTRSLESQLNNKLVSNKNSLGENIASLNALSPLNVMSRGYSVVTDENGHLIKSVKNLKSGTEFNLKVNDGSKKCTVL